MTISEYINNISEKLETIYSKEEAISVAKYFVEAILSINKIDIILDSKKELLKNQFEELKSKEERLLAGEPVQYVTELSWFYGLKFFVNKHVLIPRQETELLVDFLINKHKSSGSIKILDIGTGSGCIPICLKKFLPNAKVFAIDISEDVLDVCKKNIELNDVEIFTAKHDILSKSKLVFDFKFDLIISNPPYVLNSEKEQMHINVVDFEPEIALYVKDSDPLVFYRNILESTINNYSDYVELIFEINEKYAKEIIELEHKYGFTNCHIIKDLNNKDRFVYSNKKINNG